MPSRPNFAKEQWARRFAHQGMCYPHTRFTKAVKIYTRGTDLTQLFWQN